MIKIAIDTSSVSEKYGIRGVGFYTQRLIEAFEKINSRNFQIEPINLKKTNGSDLSNFSIIHYPYFDPFFLTLPIRKIRPTIVTVHDLIPLKFPKQFPKGLRGWAKWQAQKLSLKLAKAIITDSESSKKDIIDIVGFNKEKIYTVYLAADSQFKPLSDKILKKISQKYNLPKKFILYVGDLNWNKNISGLINGFANLEPHKKNLYLIIIGKAFLDKNLSERIKAVELIKKLDLYSRVKLLGFIPTADLVVLYNLASCLCQPSFWEGFGLPVLEAMACGCPVVCSQNSSLVEVAGEAALFADPYKPEDITRGIQTVLENQSLSHQLKEKGLKQAQKFSREKTAKETLTVYQKILNEN